FLCAATLRAHDPGFPGRILVMEPQPGPLWPNDPRMPNHLHTALAEVGAIVVPFETQVFGSAYPQGNKIEALKALPHGRPFLFLDSDTVVLKSLSLCPLDFSKPTASPAVKDTWPKPPPYGPSQRDIWQSLYDQAGLDLSPTLDADFDDDHPSRYFYCSASWLSGPCPREFGERFQDVAHRIWTEPPSTLASQSLTPWLDQIALPLVLHSLGGGRSPVDLQGSWLWHYRTWPLFFATAPDAVVDQITRFTDQPWVKRTLSHYKPFKRALYQGNGVKARAQFDQARLPTDERIVRQRLKSAGLWER
ncbi:MAG: hypothetical protein AAGF71_11075, partial [Pseudomonadota bacterium]